MAQFILQQKKKYLSIKMGENIYIYIYIYIGLNSSISPGVKIERINLIGLGSVFTKSVKSSYHREAENLACSIKQTSIGEKIGKYKYHIELVKN
jgi:hypothetical protein